MEDGGLLKRGSRENFLLLTELFIGLVGMTAIPIPQPALLLLLPVSAGVLGIISRQTS